SLANAYCAGYTRGRVRGIILRIAALGPQCGSFWEDRSMSDRIESAVADQEDAGKAAAEEQTQAEPVAASAEAPDAVADQNTPEAEQTVAPDAAESSQTADAPAEQAAEETAEESAEAESTPQPVAESAPAAESADQAEQAADAESEGTASAEEIETEEVVMPDGSKRVVRVLAVGQQVTGTVKRIADFGAFVDIGVGRDGLIHISELSVRRVGKVTDVLSEGQEVTAWIKKLDRERNRISLTLIDPETKTIRDLK